MNDKQLTNRILKTLESWYLDDLISQNEVDTLSRNPQPIVNIIKIAGEDNIEAVLLNAIELIK